MEFTPSVPRDLLHDEALWERLEVLAGDDRLVQDECVERDVIVNGSVARARVVLETGAHGSIVVIAVVRAGGPRLPSVGELRSWFHLTPREAEVALMLAERKSNKEIAKSLTFTRHTAERHTERILAKLGIGSRKHVLETISKIPVADSSARGRIPARARERWRRPETVSSGRAATEGRHHPGRRRKDPGTGCGQSAGRPAPPPETGKGDRITPVAPETVPYPEARLRHAADSPSTAR